MSLVQICIMLIGISLALSAGMSAAWLAWSRTKNAGWVDVLWTATLGLTGAGGGFLMPGAFWRHLMIALLLVIWVLRLGSHIAGRNRRRHNDPRYGKLLDSWETDAPRQMFWLMQKQALVSIPLALALLLAAGFPDPGFRSFDGLGMLIVALSIAGEALADRQLRQFQITHEKDAVCDAGLWAWSRHPNYFFQWLSWFGYALIAIDFSGTYPWGWLSLAAPACMYWLLMFISGIPPLEEHMLATRGALYRHYQDHTPAFFPWPKKTPASG